MQDIVRIGRVGRSRLDWALLKFEFSPSVSVMTAWTALASYEVLLSSLLLLDVQHM